MSDHPTPHDALFKAVFSEGESAYALLRPALAPELAAAIDPASLRAQPASFVDEELREVHRDLLFTAKLAGKDVLLYVLLEHQHSVDPLMPLRLLRYIVRVWESWLRDNPGARSVPAVLPLVLHQGPRPWTGPIRLSDLVALPPELLASARRHLPELEVTLRDLGRDPAISSSPADTPALVRLALLLLRTAAADADLVAALENAAPLVKEVLSDPRGRVRLGLLMRYTLVVGKLDVSAVAGRVRSAIGSEAGEVVMSTAQDLLNQGERRVLERQLRRRFGELDGATRARLEAATGTELEEWTDRVLEAKSLAEVLGSKKPQRRRRGGPRSN